MKTDRGALDYILSELMKGKSLKIIKRAAASKFRLGRVLKNSEILSAARESGAGDEILRKLRKKPVRTLSGITPLAVMIAPKSSCRWRCAYCPTSSGAPKSYTGEEPAALRARDAGFHPARQVALRLKQYAAIGHPTDKCEIIVMGGTFLAMSSKYKKWFIKSIYDTLNGKKSSNLSQAKRMNEHARHRAVGLTIETRPDVCGQKEITEMLRYGATRVELGVQYLDDSIYRAIKRGHTVDDVVKATALLKDAGFKVLYHIMPGLPGSSRQKNIAMVKMIFADQRFRPDMLKIYPALVLAGTEFERMFKEGRYTPYTTEEAVDVISEFYRYIPKYTRVMRIQRDVPAPLIVAGVKSSNLRELVENAAKEKKIKINEIRAREIRNAQFNHEKFSISTYTYTASWGKEVFISCEGEEMIAGFARLRIPSESRSRWIDSTTALLRELHVFGEEIELNGNGSVQHMGIGSRLLMEAECIAKEEFGKKKMVVISGVGAREYYYKKGYRLLGPYVAKAL